MHGRGIMNQIVSDGAKTFDTQRSTIKIVNHNVMESSLLGTPMVRLYFVLDHHGVVFSEIQQNKAFVFL